MLRIPIRAKVRKIARKIAEEYRPEKIILFGSHAWGNPGKDSDIDLFIVKESQKDSIERSRDVYRIIFDEGEAVDILVYTPSQLERREKIGDPFVRNIIENGVTLYASK